MPIAYIKVTPQILRHPHKFYVSLSLKPNLSCPLPPQLPKKNERPPSPPQAARFFPTHPFKKNNQTSEQMPSPFPSSHKKKTQTNAIVSHWDTPVDVEALSRVHSPQKINKKPHPSNVSLCGVFSSPSHDRNHVSKNIWSLLFIFADTISLLIPRLPRVLEL